MARMVTIEGSRVTPSDRLGRGVRAKVQLTEDIEKLVRIGAVIIVDEPAVEPLPAPLPAPEPLPEPPADPEPAEEPLPDLGVKPPPKNGATSDWVAWVSANVPYADTDGKSRDELITLWQEFDGE